MFDPIIESYGPVRKNKSSGCYVELHITTANKRSSDERSVNNLLTESENFEICYLSEDFKRNSFQQASAKHQK